MKPPPYALPSIAGTQRGSTAPLTLGTVLEVVEYDEEMIVVVVGIDPSWADAWLVTATAAA